MLAAEVQRIVETLLTPNRQNFENLLSELMIPDNDRRKLAEEVLQELKKHSDHYVRYLVSTLRHSDVIAFRAFSAMLLRKCLTIEPPILFPLLTEPVKQEVKNELLSALGSEIVEDVLVKTADATAELARYLLLNRGWPEIKSVLLQMLDSNAPYVVVAGFRMLSTLADNSEFEIFTTSVQQLLSAFERGLHQGTPAVKAEAVSALCSLAVEKTKLTKALKSMVPKCIEILMGFVDTGEKDLSEKVMESFIEVAEEAPRFLKPSLTEIFTPIHTIATATTLDPSLRIYASEFLLTIAEQKDSGLGNLFTVLPNFVECLFEIFMEFLLDIEDDPKWHAADTENADEGNGELYEFGMESLDRLSIAVGGKVLVPIAGIVLNRCIADDSWEKRHAGFICLSQIAEGCDKAMLQELDGLTDMCMFGLSDPSPKVRWSACQAIGQMCTDLAPDIQETQHQKIVPKLISAMESDQFPRVQAHASAAIVNFAEECDEENILPYLDPLVNSFIRLLHSPTRLVSESALVSLATVADTVNADFCSYYDKVMPLLLRMFTEATETELQSLRAKALECISLVGEAVGADQFRTDANHVMQHIHHLHQSHLSPSDPLATVLIQAGARMCRSLGPEFRPYLEIVMPHVLKHLNADPEIKFVDESSIGTEEDDDMESYHIGSKIIRVRSSAMEEKATACEMAACYAGILKEGFLPYLKPVTDSVVPLLTFLFSDEVRSAAFHCLPELLDAALTGMNLELGVTPEDIQGMTQLIWPAAIEALKKEEELEVQEAALHSIAKIIDVLTQPFLTETMVQSCFDILQTIFTGSEDRRQKRSEEEFDEDDDYEDYENNPPSNHADEEEQEEAVLDELATVLSSFMKKYGDAVIPYLERSLSMVRTLLENNRSPVEHRIAICIADDILEYCPQAGRNCLPEFLPILMTGASNENPELRQCCIYGLGVVACHYPDVFQPYLQNVLSLLVAALQHPSAKSRDNEMATDNAVSTIGKILIQFPAQVDPEVVENIWLKNLPLLHDDLEARTMHQQLVAMVEQQDVRVLGADNRNLASIVEVDSYASLILIVSGQVFVQILAGGETLSTQETKTRISNLLKSLSQSMGDELLSAAVSKLSWKQQRAFQEWSYSFHSQIPS